MDRLLIMFVQDYLSGDRPLEHLQQLLMDITWDRSVQVNVDTRAIAQELELLVAEYTGNHIGEKTFKNSILEATGLKPFVMSAGAQAASHQAQAWQTTTGTLTQKVAFVSGRVL